MADKTRIEKLKDFGTAQYRTACKQALKYLDADMAPDVRSALQARYPRRQTGSPVGQKIHPVVIPMVQRFADDQANAYTKPVSYELTDADGNTNDATENATAIYQRAVEDASYQERRQELHRRMIICRAYGVWDQWAHDTLRAELFAPYEIAAIKDGRLASDQRDYGAFSFDLGECDDGHEYALNEKGEVTFYKGGSAESPTEVTDVEQHEYKDAKGEPLNMASIWSHRAPVDSLAPRAPSGVVHANHEINVALSLIIDIMRWQGYGQVVLSVTDTALQRVRRQWGPSTPLTLSAALQESASMLQATTSFAEMIGILEFIAATVGWAERMAPSEMNLKGDGASVSSGFSKLVESIPKMEAREGQLTRLTIMEERVAGPRNISMLVVHGDMPEAALSYRVKVKFGGIRFPETQDERAKRYETDLDHGFVDEADLLMEREHISRNEAEERIAKNKASRPAPTPAPTQGGSFAPGVLGGLAALSARQKPGEAA